MGLGLGSGSVVGVQGLDFTARNIVGVWVSARLGCRITRTLAASGAGACARRRPPALWSFARRRSGFNLLPSAPTLQVRRVVRGGEAPARVQRKACGRQRGAQGAVSCGGSMQPSPRMSAYVCACWAARMASVTACRGQTLRDDPNRPASPTKHCCFAATAAKHLTRELVEVVVQVLPHI